MKALLVMLVLGISTFIMLGIPFLVDEHFNLSGFGLTLTIIGSMVLGMSFFISVGNSKWMNKLFEKL